MRKVLKNFMSTLLCLLIITSLATAEEIKEKEKEEEAKLEEIVVTATRTEKTPEEAPVAVSVISAEDIDRSTAKTIDEALKNMPGTFHWSRSGLAEPHPFVLMRGFSGSNRNLALIDGLPLNEALHGGINWMGIPVSNIEKIEQVRGPFSALYGGYAMGGVINLITKTPQKREINSSISYGTNDTQIYTLRYGDKFLDKLSISLGYEGRRSHGYPSRIVTKGATPGVGLIPVTGWERTRDPLDTKNLYIIGDRGDEHLRQDIYYGKVYFDITPKNNISFSVNHAYRSHDYRDYHTYLRDISGNPVDSGDITFSDNGDRKITVKPGDFLLGTGDLKRKQTIYSFISNNELTERVKLKIILGFNDLQKQGSVSPASDATLTGGKGTISEPQDKIYHVDIQLDFPIAERHIVTAGLKLSHSDSNMTAWSLPNWTDTESKGSAARIMEGKSNSYALFVQDEILLHEKVTLYVGGRYDFWKIYDGKFILADPSTITKYTERSQSYFSPKISIHYQPFKDTVLRGSAGKAFRPPTVSELYNITFHNPDIWIYGNPDLKPEVTKSWEIGLVQKLFNERTRFSATYFENHVDDLIGTVATKTDPDTGRVIETHGKNVGKVRIRGVEAEVNQKIISSLSSFVNFTLTDAKTIEDPANRENEGKMRPMIPKIMYNVGLVFSKGGVDAGITTRYASKAYSRADNKDTATGVPWGYDSIFTTDLKMSYQFTKWAKASLEVNNLFDKEFYYIYATSGRTVMGTLALTF